MIGSSNIVRYQRVTPLSPGQTNQSAHSPASGARAGRLDLSFHACRKRVLIKMFRASKFALSSSLRAAVSSKGKYAGRHLVKDCITGIFDS